ncbi:MAG: alpha/beta hydrolase [Oscillospiraceae bacterium]|nr:alpha/beta hydrolase [Oscillospiraceae bacterium]
MIYYEKYGNELNPIVIFLHGEDSVYCFTKQCDFLSKNYCAVVPHLPGFGRSGERMFSADEAVNQVTELAESFGKPVTLVGYALGAAVALPLMCRHGELFNGCVMVSPWLIKETADIEKALNKLNDREKTMKNKFLSGINSLAMGLDKDERRDYGEFCKNVDINSLAAAVDNGIKLEDYPEFAEIDKPILVLCGLKESMEVRKTARTLSIQNPNCSYDMWDGVTKNLPLKAAARFNKVLEEFIDKAHNKK